MKRLFIAALLVAATTGCTTMKPETFAQGTPAFDVFDYFTGTTRAWGVFEDRFGTIRRQFTVDIHGEVKDGELVLEEAFQFADGETDHRTWTIRRDGEGRYLGTAGDVIGEAVGRAAGNALNWRYDMDLEMGDNTLRVTFDDWMILQPDGVLINRAWVTKFGIEIGSVSIFFKQQQPAPDA